MPSREITVPRRPQLRVLHIATIVLAVLLAAVVAVGCGGRKGAGPVSSAKGLDYVPRNALFYMVFDLDFDGPAWKRAEKLLKRFPGYDAKKGDLLKQMTADANSDVDFDKDVKPWLGDEGGIAATKITAKKTTLEDSFFLWADVADEKRATSFIERESKEIGRTEYQGVDIVTTKDSDADDADKDDTTVYALTDGTLLVGNKASALKAAIRASKGRSIADTRGFEEVTSKVDDDALASLYVSGAAVRKLLEAAIADQGEKGTSLKGLLDLPQLKAMQGFAMGVSPEAEGFRLNGHAGFDQELLDKGDLGTNFEPTLLQGLPGNTVLAFGGDDLGSGLDKLLTSVKNSDPAMAQQMSQAEAMLGVSFDEITKALGGQFAVALLGAAKSGAGGVPAGGAVFEATDEAASAKVLEKLLGAATLATAAPVSKKTIAGVQALQAKSGSTTVTGATFDGKLVVGTSEQLLTSIKTGTNTLGENAAFKEAWEYAHAPDRVGGVFYMDVKGVVDAVGSGIAGAIASATGSSGKVDTAAAESTPLTSVLGWVVNDESSQTIEVFVGVGDEDESADASGDEGDSGSGA